MKKALKIVGISLGSLILLVLLILFIVLYAIVTPKRLTPIVNTVADTLLVCEHSLDEVELTFFSTFPNLGLQIHGLYVINPMPGAPSDTLLAIPELTVAVDVKKALDGHIHIRSFHARQVQANAYIDAQGQTNYDILQLPADTAAEDTTASTWQLRSIAWDETLSLQASRISFANDQDSLYASLGTTKLSIQPTHLAAYSGVLDLDAQQAAIQVKEQTYAQDLHLKIHMPAYGDDWSQITLQQACIAVNQFELLMNGTLGMQDSSAGLYTCDMELNTNDWRISEILPMLPEAYADLWPNDIQADGIIQLQAHAVGQYDSISYPLVDAHLYLKEAQGQYAALPYYFDAIAADVEAHVDLNQPGNTSATVHSLSASTKQTQLTVQGTVKQILKSASSIELGNPLCQLTADIKGNLADANYFVQSDSCTNDLQGLVKGQIKAQARLNDLTKLNYPAIQIGGMISLNHLNVIWQDSTFAQAKQLDLKLTAPIQGHKAKNVLSAEAQLTCQQLQAQVLPSKIDARVQEGKVQASLQYNTKDTTIMPAVVIAFQCSDLEANIDTIHVYALAPEGKISQKAARRNASIPHVNASLLAQKLQAQMGAKNQVSTDQISIQAAAFYNKKEQNLLLKWNPRLKVDLMHGHAQTEMLELPVDIPQVKFAYSNHLFQIDTSRIVLGNSDFSLAGQVKNVGKWLRHEGIMEGELRFTSDQTDANQLMAVINHLNQQVDTTAAPQEPTTTTDTAYADPFMVPQNMNVALITNIKKAFVFDETLEHVGGKLYIEDGKLILEEMGFVCEAAKMQLTAMYKSPRRSHIYAGLDFHLIDIDISQLIHMIPEIDSVVPMLKSFQGKAQFHIALETYMNERYQPKTSTQRGACSIEGKDLVLLDSETFNKISKILLFSPKTENLVDSISVQMNLYKDQVTIYPFCLSIDNYMVAVGGNHYLDMNFNYHASLLKPFYIGVDVNGNLDDLQIKPAKCRYAKDFRPLFHRETDSQSEELRKIIAESLKQSVKIQ